MTGGDMEKFTPDPHMLEEAERLVARIRSGEVTAFALATVTTKDDYATSWSSDEDRKPNFAILQAAIGQLNWRFMQMRQEYSEPTSDRSLGPVE